MAQTYPCIQMTFGKKVCGGQSMKSTGRRTPFFRATQYKERQMPTWKSGFVETNGIRMHYTRTSGARPPLVWAQDHALSPNPNWLAHNRAWIAGLQQQTREALIAAKHTESPTWPLDELGPWADSKLRFNPAYFQHVRPPQLNWSELLGRISCE